MDVSQYRNFKRSNIIEYIAQRMNTIYRNKYLIYKENNCNVLYIREEYNLKM
jgi:hypothetical protein